MSVSTDAYLLYGYDLGNPEDGWKVKAPEPDWLEDDDPEDAVNTLLLLSVGFTETDIKVEGYFERERAAEARAGVKLERHCSGDFPMYVLSAKKFQAWRGRAVPVDPVIEMAAAVVREGLDDKLARALKVLGLQPVQERPGWLLCSYWD